MDEIARPHTSGVAFGGAAITLLDTAFDRVEGLVWVTEDRAGFKFRGLDDDDVGLLVLSTLLCDRFDELTVGVTTVFLNEVIAFEVSTDAISDTDESSVA